MPLWVQAGLNYFRQRDRAWLLSLLAAVCLVYLPFLGNPFFFADVPFFTTDVARQYAHSLFQFDLRWLPYASLGWTAAIFGDAVALLFHLGNTLLHAANVILIFFSAAPPGRRGHYRTRKILRNNMGRMAGGAGIRLPSAGGVCRGLCGAAQYFNGDLVRAGDATGLSARPVERT